MHKFYNEQFADIVDGCLLINKDIERTYASNKVGTEGLFSGILRLITGLANMISKVLSTYKLVYRSFQDLKATEYHKYKETKRMTLYRVQNQNMQDVENLQVPIPKNMSVTYQQALTKILECLRLCDMVNRSNMFVKISSDISSKLKQDAFNVSVLNRLDEQQPEVDRIVEARKQVEACFDKKETATTKEFKQVFTDMNNFKMVEKLVDEGSKYEYDVGKIYKNLEKCSISLNTAVGHAKMLQDSPNLTKNDLLALSNSVIFIAKIFDLFGVTIQDENRCASNYLQCVKTIARVLKI